MPLVGDGDRVGDVRPPGTEDDWRTRERVSFASAAVAAIGGSSRWALVSDSGVPNLTCEVAAAGSRGGGEDISLDMSDAASFDIPGSWLRSEVMSRVSESSTWFFL